MQRIMILGQPGSGKSTLARSIGTATGLPVVHIDHIHWQAGWIERSHAEKTRLCLEVEAGDTWVFEGGHSATWANRARRADLVIWLDMPLGLRFWRVLKRSVLWHGQSRPDLPDGCPEQFGTGAVEFWHYIWRTRHRGRENILRLRDGAGAERPWVHLRNRSDVAGFTASLPDSLILQGNGTTN